MTTGRLRFCLIPGCGELVYQDTRYCLNHLTESWVDEEAAWQAVSDEALSNFEKGLDDLYAQRLAVELGIEDAGSLIMPCGHPQWAATSNGSPLCASTQHCRMCSGEIPEVIRNVNNGKS